MTIYLNNSWNQDPLWNKTQAWANEFERFVDNELQRECQRVEDDEC